MKRTTLTHFKTLSGILATIVLAMGVNTNTLAETKSGGINFTPEERAWIKQHPEVSISYMLDLQPAIIKNDDGTLTGIIPDQVKLFEEKTGIHFDIKTWPTWKETVDAGQQRDVDILGPISSIPAHAKNYHFSLPIAQTATHIYGPKLAQIPSHSMEGLKGRRVGYLDSLLYLNNYAAKHPGIDFVTYKTTPELLAAMEGGEIEFFIHIEWFEYYLNIHGYRDYRRHLSPPELYINGYLGSRSDWPELTIILNKVIAHHDQDLRAINKKWLGFDQKVKHKQQSIELTDEEKDWLADHQVIRAGLDRHWAPVEFAAQDKKLQGISSQYLKRIEDILGVKFELVDDPLWKDTYEKLIRGEVDLLPAITSTAIRREQVRFTQPYISLPLGIFASIDRAYLGGLDALKGKRVVVVEGHAIEEWLRKDYPELQLITAPTLQKALIEVTRGNAYALVSNLVTTSYYIGQSGLDQVKAVGETEYDYNLSMGIRDDWDLLPGILQKALNAIPEDEKNAIFNKWISVEYKHSVDYTVLATGLAIAAGILLVFVYWNRRLSKEVEQRRQAEIALIESNQQAQQAAKVKSEFLTNMSHEIRTPINAVISAGRLIQQTDLSATQQKYLKILAHSADALLETIDGILDFSKGEANKLILENRDFYIDNTLLQLREIFHLAASQKELELSIHLDPKVPERLKGDPEKLGQILRNLVSNAIKFTDRGQIDIRVDLISMKQTSQTALIRFSIKDTGDGIPADAQEALFTPFTQADSSVSRVHGGAGLGLAISRQLTELMGGKIALDSEVGQGSQFTIELPFAVADTAPKGSHHPSLNSENPATLITAVPELIGIRALLVEDHEINMILSKQFLELLGVEVETADRGEKALSILAEKTFDLIFMDIQMPGLDGYQTTQAIRKNEHLQTIPIIALSAHVLSNERDKCLAVGMNDYLSKPFKPEQLKETLLKWCPPTA